MAMDKQQEKTTVDKSDKDVWKQAQANPGGMYQTDDWDYATDLPVHHFREILVWPLLMRDPELSCAGDKKNPLQQHVAKLVDEIAASGSPWCQQHDPLQHLRNNPHSKDGGPGAIHPQAYGEFAYFHDYVEQFLYRQHEEGDGRASSPFYLFYRDDIKSLTVDLEKASCEEKEDGSKVHTPARRVMMDVKRCNFYIFRHGIAFLVVELATPLGKADIEGKERKAAEIIHHNEPAGTMCPQVQYRGPMTLSDVQDFLDRFRRSYVPYWMQENESPDMKAGGTVAAVMWQDKTGALVKLGNQDGDNNSAFLTPAYSEVAGELLRKPGNRAIPLFAHWWGLLPENIHVGPPGDDENNSKISWRHIVDERIPTLAFISMSDYLSDASKVKSNFNRISRGDFMRLCFADQASKAPLPYFSGFLEGFEKKHCYDRFFHWCTRQMFVGYSYTMVGSGKTFDDILIHHFRRHYFQMALLAHLERASYIAVSGRITDAVKCHDPRENQPEFHDAMMEIQSDFLEFVHRFRFTGVSNQIQAIEMFDLWRKHLDLDAQYIEIKQELDTATGFLFARDSHKLSHESHRMSLAAERLNVIATLGVVLGLAFALLGMNVLFGEGLVEQFVNELDVMKAPANDLLFFRIIAELRIFSTVLFVILMVAVLISRQLQSKVKKTEKQRGSVFFPSRSTSEVQNILIAIAAPCLFVVLVSSVYLFTSS